MTISRREALRFGAAGAAAVAAGCSGAQNETQSAESVPARSGPRIRLGVSTYSYWHFKKEKYPCEKVIEDAARIGFDGVEILHRQMEEESIAYMNKLKRLAFVNGLDLIMLSIHQDFVEPDPARRQKHIDHTKCCIDLASQMGIPCIRLNSGRWGTIRSFDDLMAAGGDEPPMEGYTDDDAFKWCVDAIEKCVPHAEKAGVVMALENHWGLTTKPEVVLRIYEAVDSPWLGVNMDTGNYVGDPYKGMEVLAPHATIVQAKTYHGGGVWYTLDLDYKRVAEILRQAGFTGYVSLEMEGKEPAETAVPKSYAILREAFG
jgi:sugar phosphate isomerase/epimerase